VAFYCKWQKNWQKARNLFDDDNFLTMKVLLVAVLPALGWSFGQFGKDDECEDWEAWRKYGYDESYSYSYSYGYGCDYVAQDPEQ